MGKHHNPTRRNFGRRWSRLYDVLREAPQRAAVAAAHVGNAGRLLIERRIVEQAANDLCRNLPRRRTRSGAARRVHVHHAIDVSVAIDIERIGVAEQQFVEQRVRAQVRCGKPRIRRGDRPMDASRFVELHALALGIDVCNARVAHQRPRRAQRDAIHVGPSSSPSIALRNCAWTCRPRPSRGSGSGHPSMQIRTSSA